MATRILVIEDNPTNLDLIVYLLNQFGYTTLVAKDGKEGLEIAQKEIPDLIICDIQLPKLNGYEVAKSLSKNPKFYNVPLIAVTAFSMVGDRDKILSVGFNGYISKPINPKTFVKQIEEFLNKEQQSNHVLPSPEISDQNKKPEAQQKSKLGATILVVDDLLTNRQLFQTLLESEGFEVELANSVSQALDFLKTTTPDLILSDLRMPHADGLDFLKILKEKEELKGIPFVFISSSNPKEYEQKACISLGAVNFIVSPVAPQVFIKTIKEAWTDSKKSKGKKNYGNDSNS